MDQFEAKVGEIMSRMGEGTAGAAMPAVPVKKRVTRRHMGLVDFLSTYDAQHYAASLEGGFTEFSDELNELTFLEAQMDIEPMWDDAGNRIYDMAVLYLMVSKMAA